MIGEKQRKGPSIRQKQRKNELLVDLSSQVESQFDFLGEPKQKVHKMKSKKVTVLIALGIFGLIIVFIELRENSLAKNGILLPAHTLEWAGSSNMEMSLKYEFSYKGERKEGDKPIQKIRGLHEFEDKYFPVFYDPKLGQSQILIDPEQFKRLNLPFPDSLSWVLKYFK